MTTDTHTGVMPGNGWGCSCDCFGAVEETEARRGGFGKSRSSSRSRSRLGTRKKPINTNIYTARRPWHGQRHSSWKTYGGAGYIYGYVYYTRTRYYRDHPDRGLNYIKRFHNRTPLWFLHNSDIFRAFVWPAEEKSLECTFWLLCFAAAAAAAAAAAVNIWLPSVFLCSSLGDKKGIWRVKSFSYVARSSVSGDPI